MATDHIRRLWRHRGATVPTPRRGPRPRLDLDEILRVAIAIADADGLGAVSTRTVAARFGRTAMALYPYVGSMENLLTLAQDQASALPTWADPTTSLVEALRAWASALFKTYLAHPWLTERPWSQASHGPNEQDWLERLLGILQRWRVTPAARAPAVTALYATTRACAQTAAAYERMDRRGVDAWRQLVELRSAAIPDFARRYPLSSGLEPVAPDWRDSPRAGLDAAVGLLADGLTAPSRRG
jgi:AcrR family transcriptional regulator